MIGSPTRARALALLALGAVAPPLRVSAQQQTTIRVGTSTADSFASPFFAQDGGFAPKAGLNLDITVLPNGERLVEAIAGNALDVAVADPIQVAHAINAGIPLAFFAGAGLYSSSAPTTVLVVAKNGPVRQPKDLEGQTIGVIGLASISALAVREWLRQNAIPADKVQLVEIPFPAMAAAVERGTVAAAFVGEPFLTAAKDDIRVLAGPYDAIGKSFYICAWFASRNWLAKNAEIAKKLGGVVYGTARWANAHPAETAPILAKYLKMDVAVVRAMTRVRQATSLEAALMQPVLDVAYRYKQLEKPVEAADIFART